jgi:hypothetical protein
VHESHLIASRSCCRVALSIHLSKIEATSRRMWTTGDPRSRRVGVARGLLMNGGCATEDLMKWMQMYLVGYVIVLAGLVAVAWKLGLIERVGPVWTAIAVVIAIGLGVMGSVSGSGSKETLEIDHKR